jgi:PAS domain-containing protein
MRWALQGYVGVSRDITAALATERRCADQRRARERLRDDGLGLSVFDRHLRLVVVNRRFREMFDFPPALCLPGTPFVDFVRHNVARGDYGDGDAQAQIDERVAQAQRFEEHHLVRERPDGSIIEVTGVRCPKAASSPSTTT